MEMSTLWLSFFGVTTEVYASTTDCVELAFFFRRFMVEAQSASDIRVELTSASDSGFFRSLLRKDGSLKSVRVVSPEGVTETSFSGWSGRPSPLPPFGYQPLRDRVCVLPGACVEAPDGTTLIIRGSTHAGKTAVEVTLALRGYHVLSDHLIVLDRTSGQVFPYMTPVGFRGALLEQHRASLSLVETRSTFSEQTGEVVLADLEAVIPGCAAQWPRTPHAVIHVGPVASGPDWRTLCFPRDAAEDALRLLPPDTCPIGTVGDMSHELWSSPTFTHDQCSGLG